MIYKSVIKEHLAKIIFLGIILVIAFVMSTLSVRERRRIWTEYPQVSIKDSINNVVMSKYKITKLIRKSADCSHLILDNNTKRTFSTKKNYDPWMGINQVLEISDRIIKDKENDTVFIYKQNTISKSADYYFILDTIQYVKPFN